MYFNIKRDFFQPIKSNFRFLNKFSIFLFQNPLKNGISTVGRVVYSHFYCPKTNRIYKIDNNRQQNRKFGGIISIYK